MSVRIASLAAVALLAGACHFNAEAEDRDAGPQVTRNYQVGSNGPLSQSHCASQALTRLMPIAMAAAMRSVAGVTNIGVQSPGSRKSMTL